LEKKENIQAYLKACVALGVRESDLFNTVDLYENKNINLVALNSSKKKKEKEK